MFMKVKSKLLLLLLPLLILGFLLYGLKNYYQSQYDQANNNMKIVNFCGRTYRTKETIINNKDVLGEISKILNYNYYNDTFPTPDSNNPIYDGLSDVSKNIKYSSRPNVIVKQACLIFEEFYTGKDIPIVVNQRGGGVNIYIGKILFIVEDIDNVNTLLVDINSDDQSGMGGSHKIGL